MGKVGGDESPTSLGSPLASRPSLLAESAAMLAHVAATELFQRVWTVEEG